MCNNYVRTQFFSKIRLPFSIIQLCLQTSTFTKPTLLFSSSIDEMSFSYLVRVCLKPQPIVLLIFIFVSYAISTHLGILYFRLFIRKGLFTHKILSGISPVETLLVVYCALPFFVKCYFFTGKKRRTFGSGWNQLLIIFKDKSRNVPLFNFLVACTFFRV